VSPQFLFSNLALACFASSSILYLISFQFKKSESILSKIAISLFTVATLLLVGSLSLNYVDFSLLAVSGTILALSISLLSIIVHFYLGTKTIGAFIAPLVILILLLQSFASQPLSQMTLSGSPAIFVYFHIVLAILGESFAVCACGVALIYLWQQRTLKKKLLNQLSSRIPALDRLESALMFCLWTGFIFITLGLISGAIYSQMYGNDSGLGLKILWAIVVWGWYLAILILKTLFKYPTKRIAQMALAGFVLLAATFFGIVLVQGPGDL
jgi:ABC-type uncharacterized transport system permease subunit